VPAAAKDGRLSNAARAGLGVSLVAMGTSTFTTLGLGALAPYLRASLHLSTFEVGALPALVFLGALTVSARAGHLTDRVGAGRALILSQLGVATGVAIAALAPGRAVFLAGVGIAGIGYGAVNPATNVLSTSLVPRRRRGLFLSIKQTGVTIGGLVAGIVLPRLADAVGWRAALLIPIAMLLTSASVGLWVTRRETAGWFDVPPATAASQATVRVRVPGPAATALFGFISSGVQLSVAAYLTVYLVDTQHFSRPTAGLALSVAFGAACLGRICWGSLSDRFFSTHATTLGVTSIGSAAGIAAIAAGVHGAALWPVVAVVGFCSIGWNGVYMALLADRAGDAKLGRATGRGLMFLYGGVVLVPPLLGVLQDSAHSWSALWAVACTAVVAAAAVLALGRRTEVSVRSGERGGGGTPAASARPPAPAGTAP
jgi:MFS family permease